MQKPSSTSQLFLQEIRIGYKVKLPQYFGMEEMVVKAVAGANVSLLPAGAAWSDEPWQVDANQIAVYQIVERRERDVPFSGEIAAIVREVEAEQKPVLGSLPLFRMLIGPDDAELEREVGRIWSSCGKTREVYTLENNISKCTAALRDLNEPDALYALRGYIRHTLGTVKGDAAELARARADFAEALYYRGLCLTAPENDAKAKDENLLRALLDEPETDAALLFSYVQRAEAAAAAGWLRAVVRQNGMCEATRKAALYLAQKSAGGALFLPDETALFSEANEAFLEKALEALAPAIPELPHPAPKPAAAPAITAPAAKKPEQLPDAVPVDLYRLPRLEPYTGAIKVFKPEQKIGFIALDDDCNFLDEGELFFHLTYVKDEALRLSLLELPFAPEKYRVSFSLYHNTQARNRSLCAGDIIWLNPEVRPAFEVRSGYISRYSQADARGQQVQKGTITVSGTGKSCAFRLADVEDALLAEYLKVYWRNGADVDVKVNFLTNGSTAYNICRAEAELPQSAVEDLQSEMPPERYSLWLSPRQPSPPAAEVQTAAATDPGFFQLTVPWTETLPHTIVLESHNHAEERASRTDTRSRKHEKGLREASGHPIEAQEGQGTGADPEARTGLHMARAAQASDDAVKARDLYTTAELRYAQARYADALELLRQREGVCMGDSAPSMEARALGQALMARCFLHLGETERAQDHARLAEANDPSGAAHLILEGLPIAEVDARIQAKASTPGAGAEESGPLPAYAQRLLDGFRLNTLAEAVGSEFLDADGGYSGTLANARECISTRLQGRALHTPTEKFANDLGMAKLVQSVKASPSAVSLYFRNGCRPFLGQALQARGDAFVLEGETESAVFAYACALDLLEDTPQDACFRRALYRSVALMLEGPDGTAAAIAEDDRIPDGGDAQQRLEQMRYLASAAVQLQPEEDVERFVYEGLLEHAQQPGLYAAEGILKRLYEQANLCGTICACLAELTGERAAMVEASLANFTGAWNAAARRLSEEYCALTAAAAELEPGEGPETLAKKLQALATLPFSTRLRRCSDADSRRLNAFISTFERCCAYMRDRTQGNNAAGSALIGLGESLDAMIADWEAAPLRVSAEALHTPLARLRAWVERERS